MSEIFPPEIVTRILTRLPVKSITRFKCVSKRWNSLISTPKFISAYISANTSASSPPPWCIIHRNITLSPTESNLYSSPTHFQLAPIPNVSTFFIKPHILSPPDNPFLFDKRPYPAMIIQSSNGLLLCSLHTKRDPLMESRKYPSPFDSYFPSDYTDQHSLVVVNPLTSEWARIPPSVHPIYSTSCVAFMTRLDPENPGVLDKFVVAVYHYITKDKSAIMMCFSSDTCRWVTKRTEHVLGFHPFRPYWALEYQGKLFWTFLSAGLIMWEDDPFTASETEDKTQCRLIPLPPGCSLPIVVFKTTLTRTIEVSGSHIHFLEMRFFYNELTDDMDLVKLWRLEDTETGVWSVMYKVKIADYLLGDMKSLNLGSTAVGLCHPYKEDTVVLKASKGYVVFYNVRTAKVVGLAKSDDDGLLFLYKLPIWPTSLSPRFWKTLDAEYSQ